jgi:hypothetical protein
MSNNLGKSSEMCAKNIGDTAIYDQLIGLGDNILENLNLFVCTQSSKIINFNYTMSAFTKKIKDDFAEISLLNGDLTALKSEHLPNFILAVNTNYEHFCQHGCEKELKLNCKKRKNNDQKKRQSQGDETIFHSAIQLNLLLNNTIEEYLNANKSVKKNAKTNIKIYKIKLYPSTGRIQIPGIINSDLSDGIQLVNKLINYINCIQYAIKTNEGEANNDNEAIAIREDIDDDDNDIDEDNNDIDEDNDDDDDNEAIGIDETTDISKTTEETNSIKKKICKIEEISIIMINYKTSLRNISPRMLFNLNSIGEYIQLLEDRYLYDGMTDLMPELAYLLPVHKKNSFSKWNDLILPPFLISDTKLKNNDKYISFIFIPFSTEVGPKKGRIATVKIFQRGKINILGVKDPKHAEQIYAFLRRLIMANIYQFIAIKIQPDP